MSTQNNKYATIGYLEKKYQSLENKLFMLENSFAMIENKLSILEKDNIETNIKNKYSDGRLRSLWNINSDPANYE